MPAPSPEPLRIDVVSDVVCPWCFIGKRRLEKAIALRPDIPVSVHYRPYFLNPWVPREGISREEYLTTKFGSVDRYKANAQRIVTAAQEEGLAYNLEAEGYVAECVERGDEVGLVEPHPSAHSAQVVGLVQREGYHFDAAG